LFTNNLFLIFFIRPTMFTF